MGATDLFNNSIIYPVKDETNCYLHKPCTQCGNSSHQWQLCMVAEACPLLWLSPPHRYSDSNRSCYHGQTEGQRSFSAREQQIAKKYRNTDIAACFHSEFSLSYFFPNIMVATQKKAFTQNANGLGYEIDWIHHFGEQSNNSQCCCFFYFLPPSIQREVNPGIVVVDFVTFFWHSHILEDFKIK